MLRFLAITLVSFTLAAGTAPSAGADMLYGNYEVHSNRWTMNSWVWAVYPCETPGKLDEIPRGCVLVSALPRPQFGAYYGGEARLVDGWYSFTSDVQDGVRCPGYVLPSRDTYTWDESTLAGSVESHFDADCFNGPPGVRTWTFALQRL